jgi:Zn-dependent protease
MLLAPSLDLTTIILLTLAFVLATAIHEANHAFVATALGDDTPRRYGRLTLNPLRHIDKMGIVFFAIAGVGWGFTPVTPGKLRPNPRTGYALVSVVGPLSNLALAFLLSLPLRAGLDMPILLRQFLFVAVSLNLLLFIFNLLPIPPLDGFAVLLGVLPGRIAAAIRPLERYGMPILMLLFLAGTFLNFSPLSVLYAPVCRVFGLPSLRC